MAGDGAKKPRNAADHEGFVRGLHQLQETLSRSASDMEKWTGWAKEMLQARDAEISALRDRIDALEERLNRAEDEGKPSLSNAEKRIAITSFLMDPERAKWSDREIARQVGASPQTVANWRQKLDAPAPEGRVVMRGGKLFEMDTRKIGTKGGDTAH